MDPRVEEALRRHPDVAAAVKDVDRELIRQRLEMSPLDRCRDVTRTLRALWSLQRATSESG
jgi:hypothetical protein